MTGQQALQIVEKEVPKIIFTDINLGDGMDGYQLSSRIKEITKVPTIVALSGGNFDSRLVTEIGIDHTV